MEGDLYLLRLMAYIQISRQGSQLSRGDQRGTQAPEKLRPLQLWLVEEVKHTVAGLVPLISLILITNYTLLTAFPSARQRDLPAAAAPEGRGGAVRAAS